MIQYIVRFFIFYYKFGPNVFTGIIAKEFVETTNFPKVMDDKFHTDS